MELTTLTGDKSLILSQQTLNRSNILGLGDLFFKNNYFNVFNRIANDFESATGSFATFTDKWQDVIAEEAYDTLEKIDDNTAFGDELPILVAQVQMLGEGINVNSFNACLTASNSEKTTMQQIGRIIRNYRIGDASKVNAGHSNIYVIFDNSETISTLLNNLEEYDLTHDCYSWGDRLDISNSSGKSIDEDEICNLNKIPWDPIDVNNDIDIVLAIGKNDKRVFTRFIDEICSGKDADGNGISDIEELDQLLLELQKTGELKYFTSRSFNLEKEVKTRQAISDSKKSRKTKTSDEKPTKTEKLVSREVLFNWINTIRTNILQNRQVMIPLWKKIQSIQYIVY